MPLVGDPSRFAIEYELDDNHGGEWMLGVCAAEGFQNDHSKLDRSESHRSDFSGATKGSRTPAIANFLGVDVLPRRLLGRICYWCGGRRVGDYELGTSLRDVLFQFDQLAHGKHFRSNRRFTMLPATTVFRLLDAALFGAADLNNAKVANEEQWARHNICPPVDVFDRWKGFLVEDGETARLLLACDPYQEVCEISLKSGDVDTVLDEARNALNEIYEHESK